MTDYYNGQITDILPHNIADDPAVQALSAAVREGTRLLVHYASLCYCYCQIDTMPDKILDLMAVELRTQYYDETLDIETKRALVANTLIWYMTAGTPKAVEELVEILFGTGEVIEWWEYGADPFWFKIRTDGHITEDINTIFTDMIRRVKNTRSHIGSIELLWSSDLGVNVGIGSESYIVAPAIHEGSGDRSRTLRVGVCGGVGLNVSDSPAAIMDGGRKDVSTLVRVAAGTGSEQFQAAPPIYS